MKMIKNLNKSYLVTFLSSTFMLMLVSSVSAEPSTSGSGDLGMILFLNICCCLFCLILFILNVYTAIWIYKDAKKLGVDNEILWTVLSLISFPFVFIIYYFVVRKEAKSKFNSSVGSNNVTNTTNTIDANNTDNSGTSTDNSNQN